MHRPRKRFGQHFLTDDAIIQHIVATIAPASNQHIIEIGPGQGVITLPLLQVVVHRIVTRYSRLVAHRLGGA